MAGILEWTLLVHSLPQLTWVGRIELYCHDCCWRIWVFSKKKEKNKQQWTWEFMEIITHVSGKQTVSVFQTTISRANYPIDRHVLSTQCHEYKYRPHIDRHVLSTQCHEYMYMPHIDRHVLYTQCHEYLYATCRSHLQSNYQQYWYTYLFNQFFVIRLLLLYLSN